MSQSRKTCRDACSRLERLLIEMTQQRASDLLLIAGAPPVMRIGGRLTSVGAPLDASDIVALLRSFLTPQIRARIESEGAADFSLRLAAHVGEEERRARRFRSACLCNSESSLWSWSAEPVSPRIVFSHAALEKRHCRLLRCAGQ